MEITLPLEQMTVTEKLRLIDTIWADLAQRPDDVPSPAWHDDVLRGREATVVAGTSSFIPLEDVEQRLRDLTK